MPACVRGGGADSTPNPYYSRRLSERRKMMQAWANFLGKLRGEAESKDGDQAPAAAVEPERQFQAA
jgi:hypothetical protein